MLNILNVDAPLMKCQTRKLKLMYLHFYFSTLFVYFVSQICPRLVESALLAAVCLIPAQTECVCPPWGCVSWLSLTGGGRRRRDDEDDAGGVCVCVCVSRMPNLAPAA